MQDLLNTRATLIESRDNGHGRGDGHDTEIWRLASGRYLIRACLVGEPWSYYVAATAEEARQAVRDGYTPGGAPGAYRFVAAPKRLAEFR